MKTCFFIFFTLVSISATSQILESDRLYNNVVLIKEQTNDRIRTGTGFLLSKDSIYYLVTARHVADSIHIEFGEIYFRTPEGKSKGFKIKQFINRNNFKKFNNNSDFFIIQLIPFDTTSQKILQSCSIGLDLLSNDKTDIPRKIDVLVFGYPIYDLEHFAPITFKSYFSSGLMNIKVNELPKPCFCYLLENPSMAGFSGGPVFAGVGDRATVKLNKTVIVGVVTGTIFDKTGGKFAIITPAFHLLDLIRN